MLKRTLISGTVAVWVVSTFAPAFAITTFGDPNDPVFLATSPFYSGVGKLTIDGFRGCTGFLLNSMTLLTAAHCVTTGTTVAPGTTVSADFGALGVFTQSSIHVFPGYDNVTGAGDLATVFLSGAVSGATTYGLYRTTDEAGQTADIAGFGRNGSGSVGYGASADGKRRHGSNFVDFIADSSGAPGSGVTAVFLAFDFDDGTSARNAFASYGSFPNLGSNTEVGGGPGDSGGPVFLNGKVAGIVSFASCFNQNGGPCLVPPDLDTTIDGSFGEMYYALRLSTYQSWIDNELSVPEPETFLLVAVGLVGVVVRRSQHKISAKHPTQY